MKKTILKHEKELYKLFKELCRPSNESLALSSQHQDYYDRGVYKKGNDVTIGVMWGISAPDHIHIWTGNENNGYFPCHAFPPYDLKAWLNLTGGGIQYGYNGFELITLLPNGTIIINPDLSSEQVLNDQRSNNTTKKVYIPKENEGTLYDILKKQVIGNWSSEAQEQILQEFDKIFALVLEKTQSNPTEEYKGNSQITNKPLTTVANALDNTGTNPIHTKETPEL